MDPATGRRWPRATAFADELYAHTMPVPAAAGGRGRTSESLRRRLRARARGMRASSRDVIDASASRCVATTQGWQPIAALDATLRMISAPCGDRAGSAGRDAERTLETIWKRARAAAEPTAVVPGGLLDGEAGAAPPMATSMCSCSGAVLVRVAASAAAAERERREAALPQGRGRRRCASRRSKPGAPSPVASRAPTGCSRRPLLLVALCLAAAGVVVEALLFRSLIDLGAHLVAHRAARSRRWRPSSCLSGILLAARAADCRRGARPRPPARNAPAHRLSPQDSAAGGSLLPSRPSSDMAERATPRIRSVSCRTSARSSRARCSSCC